VALKQPLSIDSTGFPTRQQSGDGQLDRSPVQTLGTGGGTQTIDCSLGNYAELIAPTANTTIAFSNAPAAGNGQTIMLHFKQHGTTARTLTQPASVKVAGGGGFAVSTGLNAEDLLAYTTFDGGTTWFLSGQKAFA
jgi:hypothetical protein